MIVRPLKAGLYGAGIAALLGIAFAFICVAILASQARQAIIDLTDPRTGLVAVAQAEIIETRSAVLGLEANQFAAIRRDLDAQMNGLRRDAGNQADAFRGMTNEKLDALTGVLDARLGQITAPAAQVLADSDKTVNMLRPQALGLTAAAKVTAGETAQTMRTVRNAVPAFTEAVQESADNTARLTGSSAHILERVEKRRPWWLRIFGL